MATPAEREAAVFLRTGGARPLTMVRGQGTRVWDDQGRTYLDFVAGIASDSLGHCHPAIVRTLTEQGSTLIQASNYFYTLPQLDLAELLTRESGLERVFFCNSGAEANEGAIKLVRKWGHQHRHGADVIIAAENSFHGRTLATVTATGTPRYSEPFGPLPPGFQHVPYNDAEALRRSITAQTCAILLEPVQGEGGVIVPDDDYLPAVRRLCDAATVALVLDEVQTGCGRTGTLFAFQQSGIRPDVMTLAKGLGGGVPVAALLCSERLSVFEPGDHGTTFGGQPLTTAVALAVMRTIIEEGLPAQAADKGQYLRQRLQAMEDRHPLLHGVRGKGLLLAVELTEEKSAAVVTAARERGLIANAVRPNAVRLMPPLTVSHEELDLAAAILDDALTAVEGAAG